MYLTRTLESLQFPVLLVTVARQVGKTTFLRRVSELERMPLFVLIGDTVFSTVYR